MRGFCIALPVLAVASVLLLTTINSSWHNAYCQFLGARCTEPVSDVTAPVTGAMEPTLVDHPIAGGAPAVFLDGNAWQATLLEGGPESLVAKSPLPAVVPGDIITDLQNAGVVEDPYWNVTWRDPAFVAAWNTGVWSYTRRFPTTASMRAAVDTLLVFDGIRMGATITLNGRVLGNSTDQFLRHEFHVGADLVSGAGNNVLTVTFHKDIQCGGRYTYSSQIDWAPNMVTFDPTQHVVDAQGIEGRETFGFGIWKSVYLVPVQSVAILQFVPHTFYAGGHPTTILNDGDHAGFEISARVIMWAPTPVSGQLSINLMHVAHASSHVSLVAGLNNFTLTIPANATLGVQLWHPRGHGAQPRYNISTSFIPVGGTLAPPVATWRLLGFRHVALVTVNDTDPTTARDAKTQDGSGEFGMFFRVNGAAVYARGGNKVPMDLLDGRLTAENHHRLVHTAAEGNMNMLRVWGGGIWEPRAFFDACDELGVLVYLDMQFSWNSAKVPGGTSEVVRKELQYQLQRVSHHASIVIFDACNECDGGGVYDSFVMPTVAAVDQSRPIWPSSPGQGWSSGVDRLSGRPNGKPLSLGVASNRGVDKPLSLFSTPIGKRNSKPVSLGAAADRVEANLQRNTIELHGPYNGLGTNAGKVGENNSACDQEWCAGTTIPSAVPGAQTGPMYGNIFHSEFGCVAWSSFESIAAQLPADQWSLHSTSSHYRNWPVDNVIQSYFGDQDLNAMGEVPFKKQLYQSLLGQALFLKKEIEEWRAQNIFGSLIWMYNEIWPTGGWGSIEYGGGTSGQVPGGRWKPLHYFFKASVFADQLATCNTKAECYIKNDSPFAFTGKLKMTLLNVLTGSSVALKEHVLSMSAGPGVTEWLCATDSPLENERRTQYVELPKDIPPSRQYSKHADQIPVDSWTPKNSLSGSEAECVSSCDGNPSCVGYTTIGNVFPTQCFFYTSATGLKAAPGDNWFPKQYSKHADQIPVDSWINLPNNSLLGSEAECVSRCDDSPSCVGYTTVNNTYPTRCYLYTSATGLKAAPGVNWFRKPGPPKMQCTPWAALRQWPVIGCDATGSNCLLTVEVVSDISAVTKSAATKTASFNVLPFQPPKAMRLPPAVVTVQVEEPIGDRVPLKLSSSFTALFVTLTTKVPGRFSDNAFLLKAGSHTSSVDFIPWGAYGPEEHALLQASLRVEHLVENL